MNDIRNLIAASDHEIYDGMENRHMTPTSKPIADQIVAATAGMSAQEAIDFYDDLICELMWRQNLLDEDDNPKEEETVPSNPLGDGADERITQIAAIMREAGVMGRPDHEAAREIVALLPVAPAEDAVEAAAALQALSDGYEVEIERGVDNGTGEPYTFISVENPDYEPDNGAPPRLVIDVRKALASDPARQPQPAREAADELLAQFIGEGSLQAGADSPRDRYFSGLVKKGWLKHYDSDFGMRYYKLTDDGRAALLPSTPTPDSGEQR